MSEPTTEQRIKELWARAKKQEAGQLELAKQTAAIIEQGKLSDDEIRQARPQGVIKNPRGLLDFPKEELQQALAAMDRRPIEVLQPGMEYINVGDGTGRIVDVDKGCPVGTRVFNLDAGQEIEHCTYASEPDGQYVQVQRCYDATRLMGVVYVKGKARLKVVLPGEPWPPADQPRIVPVGGVGEGERQVP